MKKTSENSKKGLLISIAIHGLILLSIATMTIKLTMPEGNVVSTINFNAIVPEGKQLDTPNVSKIPQRETPEKVKDLAAPPPPPPDISEDSIQQVETEKDGSLDVIKDMPDYAQNKPEPETEPEPEPVASPAQEAPLPPPEISGDQAKTIQTGNDQVDLKGQDQVADQNMGRAQGPKQADLYLKGVAGNRKPEYPLMANLRRIQNKLVVAVFEVDANGRVSNVRIDKSENDIFNSNVLSAVKNWRFVPPVEAGTYFQPFRFELSGQTKEAPALLRRK